MTNNWLGLERDTGHPTGKPEWCITTDWPRPGLRDTKHSGGTLPDGLADMNGGLQLGWISAEEADAESIGEIAAGSEVDSGELVWGRCAKWARNLEKEMARLLVVPVQLLGTCFLFSFLYYIWVASEPLKWVAIYGTLHLQHHFIHPMGDHWPSEIMMDSLLTYELAWESPRILFGLIPV
ncbi:uncharacterized protein EI90DRAFT_3022192 [Cantharellus anzutake]|uniref:uncharacterized protein n=1 Tax=Cantharellus anzutake TaxID=1750568 RepID=UPI0019086B16|nr:uncharacterized protein EI90DRAFT_3022192 [Cantharellus anzutake]KAF8314810.1 hypothetical protein EI90DRAFT_3022192 [Cantharellus anzutake]